MNLDVSPKNVDLASEPAFTLGAIEVRPNLLEVEGPAGREQLEPRVMQVLVALARRRGEIVSKDELILSCWGRIVGEDSVNRCLSRLRQLSERMGGYTLDTIPRVGVRLREQGAEAPKPAPTRRFVLGAAAALLVTALALGALWMANGRRPHEPRVAVNAFAAAGGGTEAGALAASLRTRLRGRLAEDVPGLAVGGTAADGAKEDLRVSGLVLQAGPVWRVRVNLEDAPTGLILWSGEFENSDPEALFDAAAAALAETLSTALEPLQQKGLKVDARTLAIYLRANDLQKQSAPTRTADRRRAFEQVVVRAPNFVAARSVLSLDFALEAAAAGSETATLRQRSRQEAQRAIGADPSQASSAYDALFQITRQEAPGDLATAEAWLRRGMVKAPAAPWAFMRECAFLADTGLAREAVSTCGRAVALRPTAAPVLYHQALALAASGQVDFARRTIDRAARMHPLHSRTRLVRFELAAFDGDPTEARRLLHDPDTAPPPFDTRAVAAFDSFLQARSTGAPQDKDKALSELRAGAEGGWLDSRYLVMAASRFGRLDEAFAAADRWPSAVGGSPVAFGYLFDPATAALRTDPRFWALARRVGLVAYWRARGVLPDFCADPSLTPDCRTGVGLAKGR